MSQLYVTVPVIFPVIFSPCRHSTSLNTSYTILSRAALCAGSEFIYLCGGELEECPRFNRVFIYDPVTKVFEELPPMETERAGAAAIFYQGSLYVVGGTDVKDKDSVLKTVEKYDPDTNEWSNVPWINEPRYLPSLAILDKKLYVCGGRSSNTNSKISSVKFYDPTKKIWQPAASMNKPRAEFLVIAHEGKLLAIGGDKKGTVELYDPSKDEWQMDEEMSKFLKIHHLGGGFITKSCLTAAAMKFFFGDRLVCYKML